MQSQCRQTLRPITAVIRYGTQEKLEVLKSGVILIPWSVPDSAGMIDAVCEGEHVRVFARDLEERSQPIEIEQA